MTSRLLTRSLIGLSVVAALVAITACTSRQAPLDPPTPTSAYGCAQLPLNGCHEVVVAGRVYQYYLALAEEEPQDQDKALLVDLGGPGVSLASVLSPDYADQLRRDLGPVAAKRSLLLIEEPWVTGRSDHTCQVSMRNFYAWARVNWDTEQSADPPQIDCPWGQGIYGWSRSTYRNVVTAIREAWNIRELDMAALSFGAVRYSYIDDMVGHAFLVRPAAAPGTPNEYVLQARTAALWRSITADCIGCDAANIKEDVRRLLERYSTASIELPNRSVPVTAFDIASALVAAAMDGVVTTEIAWDAESLTVDEEVVAAFADALWLRIGEQDLSPAMVAYADEYCQAYVGAVERSEFDAVERILGAPTMCTRRDVSAGHAVSPVACLIVGINDVPAPAVLASTWEVHSDGVLAESLDPRHSFTGIEQC